MNSTLFLFLLGILGIFAHSLVELNKLNKANNGDAKILEYIKLEKFSILISFVVVVICLIAKHEIIQLEYLGNYLGLGFVAIGYMGQSLLVWGMGKATKTIGKEEEK